MANIHEDVYIFFGIRYVFIWLKSRLTVSLPFDLFLGSEWFALI